MNYIELSCTINPTEPGKDILMAELSDIGFESFVETETGLLAYITQAAFSTNALHSIIAAYSPEIEIIFQEKIIKKENWNQQWESSFQPITINNKCIVYAPFHTPPLGIEYAILIEPKMSFGTGHHETTHLMLEKLLHLELNHKAILDMGCGTGVLAILAAKKGAITITAIDIDEWAYKNTIENIALNNCPHIMVQQGDATLLQPKQYNLILANINRNILLQDMLYYEQALLPKGELLMSGFLITDINSITTEAIKLGFQLLQQKQLGNWALLHFGKAH